MLDSVVHVYEKQRKRIVADASDRRRWKKIGVRMLIRRSMLSQKAVYEIIQGQPVRRLTLATFRHMVDG